MSDVLYRKYRPQTLDELRGQEHVKKILRNALKENQVGHAFLFSGPRGVGKTSVARILAKELGVQGVDLVEIDAASHRGIEDVRQIRESVNFQPSQGARKLYILDEVHMLTNEAFNALLKTLEEPPAHAYFVLCTTEVHKVPVTIVSRCQRLTFVSPEPAILATYLQELAQKEGYELAEEAAHEAVILADGSFRDALVVLDQLMQVTDDKNITLKTLEQGIGATSSTLIEELYSLIVQKDVQSFSQKVKSMVSTGADFKVVLNRLIVRISEDLISEEPEIGEGSASSRDLVRLLDHLMEARRQLVYVHAPHIPFVVEVLKWQHGDAPSESSHKAKPAAPSPQAPTPASSRVAEASVTVSAPQPAPTPEVPTQSTAPIADSADATTIEVTTSTTTDSTAEVTISDGDIGAAWNQVLTIIKQEKRSVEALLKDSRVLALNDKDELVLEFPYEFHKRKIEEVANRQVIEQVIERLMGRKIIVKCQLKKSEKREVPPDLDIYVETGDSADGEPGKSGPMRPKKPSGDKDFIAMAQEVFGGQLIE